MKSSQIKLGEWLVTVVLAFLVILATWYGVRWAYHSYWEPISNKIERLNSRIPMEGIDERRKAHEEGKDSSEVIDCCSPCIHEAGGAENCTQQGKSEDSSSDKFISETDLAAQEGMWEAAALLLKVTFWQFGIFIISMLASAIGLWLIYRTLQETNSAVAAAQNANKIAQMSVESVNRAWCYVNVGKESSYSDGEFHIKYSIVNAGKTPANSVRVDLMLIPGNKLFGEIHPYENLTRHIEAGAEFLTIKDANESILTLFPIENIPETNDIFPAGSASLLAISERGQFFNGFDFNTESIHAFCVCAIARYTTVFSQEARESYSFYSIKKGGSDSEFFVKELTQYRVMT